MRPRLPVTHWPAPSGFSWSGRAPTAAARRADYADRFLFVFGIALLGYGLLGRGFAYLGIPPLFVGEMLLAAGLLALVNTRSLGRVLELGPMPVLGLLMAWVLLRTIPYLGAYGVDAARDAMIVGYGLFAFIAAGLLMAKPERLNVLLERYRIFAVVIVATAWAIYLVVRQAPDLLPIWPWSNDTRIIENKPGDLLVHLAGITAFLVLGFRRATPLLLALLLMGMAVAMVGNRGGMVAYVLAMGLFWLMKPREARFGRLIYVGALLILAALIADTSHIETNEGSRTLAVEQIWENARSVFGQSDSEALKTTTAWRLEWWSKIVGYTFGGPYFWQGKGFGVNLATADDFQVDLIESLRSPHNAHLTMLARGGVPGFLLWLIVHGLWFGTVLGAWRRAKSAGQARWQGLFAFLSVYWLAALVNASFDVYLEGPMGGIWFWTLFGVGMGAVWIFRHQPKVLDEASGAPEGALVSPRFGWPRRSQTAHSHA